MSRLPSPGCPSSRAKYWTARLSLRGNCRPMTNTVSSLHSWGVSCPFHSHTWWCSESSAARAAAEALAMSSGVILRVNAMRSAGKHCRLSRTESTNWRTRR